MRIKPFRVLAAILLAILAIEVYGICHIHTYEKELAAAKAAYASALAENMVLKKAAAVQAAAGENTHR